MSKIDVIPLNMNIQKPFKLSICIPTYNRYKSLKALLVKLTNQNLYENVQIVVSNNASTDKTDELCKSLLETYESFKYIKQETNIGFAGNVEAVVKESDGEYIWILGDDDIPNDNAIKQILLEVDKCKVGWLLFNFKRNNSVGFKGFLESDIKNINDLLKNAGIWSSFMSLSVLKKDALYRLEDIPKNNYYAFSLALNTGSSQDVKYKNFCLVERKMSKIENHRFNESSTYAIDFFEYLDKLVSSKKISHFTRNSLARQFFFGILSLYLMKNKLSKTVNPKFIDLYRRHKYVFVFYFTIVPIYLFNRAVLNLILLFAKAINSILPTKKLTKATNFLTNHE